MSQEGSPRFVVAEMTWPEVKDALSTIEVVLLPTGSAEQHGPNTGFGTDTGRAEGFCRLLAERMHPRALAVPPVAYGISHHHMRFPGLRHCSRRRSCRSSMTSWKATPVTTCDRS